jgi:uroporphyrinogen decarboxylase
MNSRERIRKAVNHENTDRIPIDLGSIRSSGIATIAYNKLRKELGINVRYARMHDFIQQIAYPEKEIMDMFHVDAIDAGQAFLKTEDKWREWILNDGSKCLIPKYLNIEVDSENNIFLKNKDGTILGIKPVSSLYVDQCFWVYKDFPSLPETFKDEDLDKHMWAIPSPPWYLDIFNDQDFEIFKKNIKELYDNTEYCIVLGVGLNLFETGNFLRGIDNFLCDIYLDKNGTGSLLDRLVERNLKKLDRIIKGVCQYVDILQFGDDLGSQGGPFMSPNVYKEVFKPRHKKMWDFVHENSKCKVFLHSCGSIYELLPHLIDAGLDILNPVQTSAIDMEPEKLKKEFGKYITFWGGGCDTRDVLPSKTPKEIKEHVKRRIDILGKDGGFVFNQVHNILADIPPENVIAMLQAACEY